MKICNGTMTDVFNRVITCNTCVIKHNLFFFSGVELIPRPNKCSEADVIAYKAHVKGGSVEIWLGQVRRVDLPNTLKVDWFDSANHEQIFMMVVLFPLSILDFMGFVRLPTNDMKFLKVDNFHLNQFK